jgi:heat shock protein HslJ
MEPKEIQKKQPQMILLIVLSVIIVFGFLAALTEMYRDDRPRHRMVHKNPTHYVKKVPLATIAPEGKFRMMSYGNSETTNDVSDREWMVMFTKDMSVSGKVCNSFSGAFVFTKGIVQAKQVVATEMACGDTGIMEAENALHSGFTYGFMVTRDPNGVLLLEDKETKNWFELVPVR